MCTTCARPHFLVICGAGEHSSATKIRARPTAARCRMTGPDDGKPGAIDSECPGAYASLEAFVRATLEPLLPAELRWLPRSPASPARDDRRRARPTAADGWPGLPRPPRPSR